MCKKRGFQVHYKYDKFKYSCLLNTKIHNAVFKKKKKKKNETDLKVHYSYLNAHENNTSATFLQSVERSLQKHLSAFKFIFFACYLAGNISTQTLEN